ncbi:MFS transporter [Actinomycetaceae bacterium TAE3-ERU4]|nr:MFS transporter [Actinomycetaceae bacterium TAE3-ERU4]
MHMNTAENLELPPPPLRKNSEYRLWLAGSIFRGIGTQIGAFAFPLVAYYITQDTAIAGTVAMIDGIGMALGFLPGGIIADRYDRRAQQIISAILGILTQVALVLILLSGHATWEIIAVIGALDSFRVSLLGLSGITMLKQMVPQQQLPNAFAVNEGRDSAIAIASKPLSGALLALGMAVPALIDLLGQAGSLLFSALMKEKYPPSKTPQEPKRVREDLSEGFKWISATALRREICILVIILNIGINGILGTVTLWLAENNISPAKIGFTSTGIAVGILLGSLATPIISKHLPTGKIIFLTTAFQLVGGIGVIAAGLNLTLITLSSIALGLGVAPANAGMQSYLMHITPTQMQGRVSSIIALLATGILPFASAFSGWSLKYFGGGITLTVFTAFLVFSLALILLGRKIIAIPHPDEWEENT